MDKFTLLKECTDRIMATSVTATWRYAEEMVVTGSNIHLTVCTTPQNNRYNRVPANFDRAYDAVKEALFEKFFGPSDKGVYSPSVQFTMYEMGVNAIRKYVFWGCVDGRVVGIHSSRSTQGA